MFVSCEECGYETSDRDSNEELKADVEHDGGLLGEVTKCPECGRDSLSID